MTVLAPTIGRIVHFYDPIQPPHANRGIGSGPYAAIVIRVIDTGDGPSVGAVDLSVLTPEGDYVLDDIPHVSSLPPELLAAGAASWDWPPHSVAYLMIETPKRA